MLLFFIQVSDLLVSIAYRKQVSKSSVIASKVREWMTQIKNRIKHFRLRQMLNVSKIK